MMRRAGCPIRRRREAGLVLALGLACAAPPPEPPPAPADWVLHQGGVYTGDPQRIWAEGVALRDGQIVALGSNEEVGRFIDADTRVMDLRGRMALPGFHDAHVHPLGAGHAMLGCPLQDAKDVDALVEALRVCAAEGGDDDWVVGDDFDLALFPNGNPRREVLDAILPDRPVLVRALDGHNSWVNTRALERAGITAGTPDPPKGVIERDPRTGVPSGTLRESAEDLVERHVPTPTAEEDVEALRAAVREMNRYGITSFIDASVGEAEWRAYRTLDGSGELTARVRTSLTYGAYSGLAAEEFDRLLTAREDFASARVRTDSVKLFLDGVLEGETAALIEPYTGMGTHRGELNLEPAALADAVTRFDGLGLQVHMHAIGDAAVRAGLDAVAAARERNGPGDNRHHISHLQLIAPGDVPRFSALDVTANFQSLWAYPDAWILELNLPVLGRERVERMYPIGSVERSGARIVGGSDWSVSSVNPLLAIETALRRADPQEDEAPALNAGERVDLATMLDAYTRNGAWLMHQEDRVGTLAVGMRGDLVVLGRDLFAIPRDEIGEVEILLTLLDGVVVYEASAAQR
jgi:predicted amidohydrolase YtcJ